MPFGGLLSIGLGGLGIGSALGTMFGGNPASKVKLPPQYQYQNQAGADAGAYGGIGDLSQYNVAGSVLPQYQAITNQLTNNPTAGGYYAGASQAGALGQNVAMNNYNIGGGLTNNAMSLTPNANTLMNNSLSTLPDVQALLSLGFDPQNALYSKLQQQNTDQTNASLASRGLATTPYGAGVASDSNQNFNLGWQNNLLSRASQGAGAAGNLLGAAGGGLSTGAGMLGTGANIANTGQTIQSQAPGQYMWGSQAPYGAYGQINTDALSALSGLGSFGQQASAIPQMQISDYLNYLSGGTAQQGANQQGAQVGLNQANLGFNQNQTLGSNLGTGLATLTKGWNALPSSNPSFSWG